MRQHLQGRVAIQPFNDHQPVDPVATGTTAKAVEMIVIDMQARCRLVVEGAADFAVDQGLADQVDQGCPYRGRPSREALAIIFRETLSSVPGAASSIDVASPPSSSVKPSGVGPSCGSGSEGAAGFELAPAVADPRLRRDRQTAGP